jgi:hypothetical protein
MTRYPCFLLAMNDIFPLLLWVALAAFVVEYIDSSLGWATARR